MPNTRFETTLFTTEGSFSTSVPAAAVAAASMDELRVEFKAEMSLTACNNGGATNRKY